MGQSCSVLIKPLCNPSWKLCFEETNVLHLPRVLSDHCPILLNTQPTPLHLGQKPFRLETMWFNDPSFPALVKNSQLSFPLDVPLTIRDFTEKVTIWNREIFGNHFHKKLRLVARLTGIQKSLAFRPCIDLMDVESTLTSQYHNILLLKEEFWALKSHLHWATLGDRNTSFFHLSTMCKRHHNKIWCLKNSLGSWSQSLEELKSIIQNHFTDLYTIGLTTFTPFAPQPDYLHTLSLATRDSLSENVSKSDIFKSIHSFNPLKSPGPDGLHPIFFQKYCDIIGDSVTAFIQGIFKLKKMPPELNSTLICLIPKVSNPESISQF